MAATWGDFSRSAPHYVHEPGYPASAIDALRGLLPSARSLCIADIGAGTGNLTRLLSQHAAQVWAVEPNRAMMQEGQLRLSELRNVTWVSGHAEATNLSSCSIDWICMGNAFHWADSLRALHEFDRLLKSGGRLSVIWNLRAVDEDPVLQEIEALVRRLAPGIGRVYLNYEELLAGPARRVWESTQFDDCVYINAKIVETFTKDRYIGMWRGAHNIPAQVDKKTWDSIITEIGGLLNGRDTVDLHMRAHCWSVKSR
ncbi:class I SAM-dependent methyltransferase [Mesorhizobium sp. M0293]|uniref:class I SAM-dependent methyltransferase n=1 Tax=Mesorhizobium sp. M0293 TaxID=2956930 RepID=UPI00333D0E84